MQSNLHTPKLLKEIGNHFTKREQPSREEGHSLQFSTISNQLKNYSLYVMV